MQCAISSTNRSTDFTEVAASVYNQTITTAGSLTTDSLLPQHTHTCVRNDIQTDLYQYRDNEYNPLTGAIPQRHPSNAKEPMTKEYNRLLNFATHVCSNRRNCDEG